MINQQILKFIITGSINTLFYYILYSIFIFLEFDYKLAVLFGTLFGILFSFKTFGKFVFENQDNKNLYKFISVYIVLYLLNIVFISIFERAFHNYYISGLIATAICAVISYFLNKLYVFK